MAIEETSGGTLRTGTASAGMSLHACCCAAGAPEVPREVGLGTARGHLSAATARPTAPLAHLASSCFVVKVRRNERTPIPDSAQTGALPKSCARCNNHNQSASNECDVRGALMLTKGSDV